MFMTDHLIFQKLFYMHTFLRIYKSYTFSNFTVRPNNYISKAYRDTGDGQKDIPLRAI